jgi:glycosyltransferase involved in cell wall biosynthesis
MIGNGKPRLSVVVPTYNHGHYIDESLAAIAGQSEPPFEVVVVDDGSTDDTASRLEAIAGRLPRLRVERHPVNRGVSAACNTGLALVRGDFVLFSAADDRMSARMVERAGAAAAVFPHAGIVFSDQSEMSADGSVTRLIPLPLPQTRRYFPGEEFVRLMQGNFFFFHVSCVWFRTDVLRALGGFHPDLRWHSDLLAAYAAAFEHGAVYQPDAVSYVRVLPTSYGASGARSDAQPQVLRAWLRLLRQPGWERRRAAFVAAAVWPEYTLRGLAILRSDPGYLSARLLARTARIVVWTKLAPLVGTRLRERLRGLRLRLRGAQWREK